MKKILFRKLLSDFLIFFILSLISTGVVIWIFQAVNFLDIMIEDGRDYLVYINYTLLNFPKIIAKIFPFVLFFSLFYVITKYEINNELMIFWNFGVSKISVINFFFKISILLMLIQLTLNSLIVPVSQDFARSFLRTSTVNFFDNFVKPKKFNDTIKGLTIYADKKDRGGNLQNLYLKKKINENEFQITYAQRGAFEQKGANQILVLYEGATITSKNNKITNISFSKSDFSLANLKTNTTTYKKTQEISTVELIKCISNFYKYNQTKFEKKSKEIENCTFKNINNIFKEVYKRFITPTYIPLLSLIPLLLILLSKENLRYQRLRYFTFSTGFIIIVISETAIRFISSNTLQNLSLFLLPIVFFLIIYLIFLTSFKNRIKSI